MSSYSFDAIITYIFISNHKAVIVICKCMPLDGNQNTEESIGSRLSIRFIFSGQLLYLTSSQPGMQLCKKDLCFDSVCR